MSTYKQDGVGGLRGGKRRACAGSGGLRRGHRRRRGLYRDLRLRVGCDLPDLRVGAGVHERLQIGISRVQRGDLRVEALGLGSRWVDEALKKIDDATTGAGRRFVLARSGIRLAMGHPGRVGMRRGAVASAIAAAVATRGGLVIAVVAVVTAAITVVAVVLGKDRIAAKDKSRRSDADDGKGEASETQNEMAMTEHDPLRTRGREGHTAEGERTSG